MLLRPKDYIVVENKLFFAVVSDVLEDERTLTLLRYVKDENGMQKLETEQANHYVLNHHPEYTYHSQLMDIELHGIPLNEIDNHLRPEQTIATLLNKKELDDKQKDAIAIISLLIDSGIDITCLGITGSLMLEIHNRNSDIDIVIYGRDAFFKVREIIKQNIFSGNLNSLDEITWRESWKRRNCELAFDQYYAHEKRKYNKCLSGTSKVDISMIPAEDEKISEQGPYKKMEQAKIISRVVDDSYSYDFPARYGVDNDTVNEVVSYTATYIGQAQQGETIEAAGYIEEDKNGHRRLLVGTSREAQGEYIKIIKG